MGRKAKEDGLDYLEISKEYLEEDKTLPELIEKYDISMWKILTQFKKLGIRKYTRRHYNKNFFSTYTPESCYWAGFIAADGWVEKYRLCIELSKKDKSHLIKFQKCLNSNADIRDRERTRNNKVYKMTTIIINSVDIVKDLKNNFNIVPRKTLTYQPPTQIPENLMRHFLRGYIDGDGCISHNKGWLHFSICGTSIDFFRWLKDFLNDKFNSNMNIGIKKPNFDKCYENDIIHVSNIYSLATAAYKATDILNWLYDEVPEHLRLERKFNRFLKYNKLMKEKRIVNGIKRARKKIKRQENIDLLESYFNKGLQRKDILKQLNWTVSKYQYYLKLSKQEKNNCPIL